MRLISESLVLIRCIRFQNSVLQDLCSLVCSKVIGIVFTVGLPTGRDSATFRDNGTEVSSLSRDKGTTGQAKNLSKGRDGPGQTKFGMVRDNHNLGRDTGQNGTEQKKVF